MHHISQLMYQGVWVASGLHLLGLGGFLHLMGGRRVSYLVVIYWIKRINIRRSTVNCL